MGAIVFEDFSQQTEFIDGYYDPELDVIYIDSDLSEDRQEEVLIHEVLESWFYHQYCVLGQVSHSSIERLTNEVYFALKVLKERNNGYRC